MKWILFKLIDNIDLIAYWGFGFYIFTILFWPNHAWELK